MSRPCDVESMESCGECKTDVGFYRCSAECLSTGERCKRRGVFPKILMESRHELSQYQKDEIDKAAYDYDHNLMLCRQHFNILMDIYSNNPKGREIFAGSTRREKMRKIIAMSLGHNF